MTSNKIHILDAPFSETTSINLCDLIMVFVFQFFQSIQMTMYYVRIDVRKMERITIGVINYFSNGSKSYSKEKIKILKEAKELLRISISFSNKSSRLSLSKDSRI